MPVGQSMKSRLPSVIAWVVALSLLLLSGPSCVIDQHSLTQGHARPTTASESKSFVTPECEFVRESLRQILGDPPYEPTRHGFDAIRYWIAHNIEYMSDQERIGEEDDWQTPRETLAEPRVGDCEDFSLLVCALLRAYGIPEESVFVVIGVDGKGGEHAFLIENWYEDGEWRVIEPQAPASLRYGFPFFRSVDSELTRYRIILAFNDVHYYDESFPWDDGQGITSYIAETLTAVDNAARRVSQVVSYLLGLLPDDG